VAVDSGAFLQEMSNGSSVHEYLEDKVHHAVGAFMEKYMARCRGHCDTANAFWGGRHTEVTPN